MAFAGKKVPTNLGLEDDQPGLDKCSICQEDITRLNDSQAFILVYSCSRMILPIQLECTTSNTALTARRRRNGGKIVKTEQKFTFN